MVLHGSDALLWWQLHITRRRGVACKASPADRDMQLLCTASGSGLASIGLGLLQAIIALLPEDPENSLKSTYLLQGPTVELAVQDQRVISVACGAEHSVASVESGEVRLVFLNSSCKVVLQRTRWPSHGSLSSAGSLFAKQSLLISSIALLS